MSGTRVPAALRRLVEERAGHRYEYCLLPAAVAFFPHKVDHVIAASRRLFDPRAQRWRDHFAVREGVIVGVTPEGRGTARAARATMIVAVNERATAQVTADQPARGGGWSRKTRKRRPKKRSMAAHLPSSVAV